VIVTLRPLGERDIAAVQEVLASDPGYTERVFGRSPADGDAQALMTECPPGLPADRKVVLGVCDGTGFLVGVADLLRGYPEVATAYVGLLQIRADRQRQGLGRAAHAAVAKYCWGWPEISTLQLSLVATNRAAADPFWRSLGYRPTGELFPFHGGPEASTAQRYELRLPRTAL
jgi:GNAT superfamily N-acetyltransferase